METDETGEEEPVKKESVIRVEQKNTASTPSIPVNKPEIGENNQNNGQEENTLYPAGNNTSLETSRSGNEMYKDRNRKAAPKTEDRAYKKEFEFLTVCFFSCLCCTCLEDVFQKERQMERLKRKD